MAPAGMRWIWVFSKLEPQGPVPEPSSIVVFAAFGLLGAGFSAIGRRRRTGPALLGDHGASTHADAFALAPRPSRG